MKMRNRIIAMAVTAALLLLVPPVTSHARAAEPETGGSSALICLDPGHGGSDPGACGHGLQEKDANLDIALRMRKKLQEMNFPVIMTRETDVTMTLQERCDIANKAHAGVFVSIHNNSYTAESQGTETYCYYDSVEGRKLATYIHKNVVQRIKRPDRGVKEAGFFVLRNTDMTATLMEGAFVSNAEEAALLQSPSFRQKIAEGAADGINAYIINAFHFDTYVLMFNPDTAATAEVLLTYMENGSQTQQAVEVPPCTRRTVCVNDRIPVGDFSTAVQSTNGVPVVAERAMYFNYSGVWTGGHDTVGALSPAPAWYFAEGTCRPYFDPYLCIQNPGGTVADVRITYMRGDGTTRVQELGIAAASRSTVNVKDVLGEGDDAAHDFSAKVECVNGQLIIAERPVYFDYHGYTELNWTGGHNVVGATSPQPAWYFAEGTCRPNFDAYLCVQNPWETEAAVRITYMKGDGKTRVQEVGVKGNSRYTVKVKDVLGEGDDAAHDFSARVECTSGQSIIAERPMYFNYYGAWTGGHNVMGAIAPQAAWYFAEGTCRPNFDPYFCIQNPGGDKAAVRVTYMRGDGTVKVQELEVPGNSRHTVRVIDVLGQGNDPSHDFSAKIESANGQPIIAERPMYFCYQGYKEFAWTGGHDVMGAQGPALNWFFAEGCTR